MLSAMLGLAAFVIVRGLEFATLPALSIFVVVPVTGGIIAVACNRFARVRERRRA